MKFEKFKELVEKRQMLLNLKDTTDDDFLREEFEMQIEETEEEIFGEYQYSTQKLYKVFFLGSENVLKILESYFERKDDLLEIGFMGYNLDLNVITKTNRYNLGDYEKNQALTCLYSRNVDGWENFFADYPDLKEYLWSKFREIKTNTKLKHKSTVQQDLNKVDNELSYLNSPERIKQRIIQLMVERDKLQESLDTINSELDEIGLNT